MSNSLCFGEVKNYAVKIQTVRLYVRDSRKGLLRDRPDRFKVCKSVHHHTIQINHQIDEKNSQVYYLTFIYSSTCFGRPHAHHQEFNNCSSSFWFLTLERGVSSAVGRGRTGRSDHDQQHCYHHALTLKPEADTAVGLLMMGVRTPET